MDQTGSKITHRGVKTFQKICTLHLLVVGSEISDKINIVELNFKMIFL